jgi:hypothetical protein
VVFVLAILMAPFFLGVAGVCVWKALRKHRPRLLIFAFAALSFEALVVMAGVWQAGYVVPTNAAERDAPGTYVRLGHEARDELRLLPDGQFSRTAVYRGVTQHQSGRWTYTALPREGAATFVDFEELSPRCLRSAERPGTVFHYLEPDGVLCLGADDGSYGGFWCWVRGQGLALCLGDDGFEYVKQ